MKFVVRSQESVRVGYCKRLYHTDCALCSEDPRFCGDDTL